MLLFKFMFSLIDFIPLIDSINLNPKLTIFSKIRSKSQCHRVLLENLLY